LQCTVAACHKIYELLPCVPAKANIAFIGVCCLLVLQSKR